MCTCPDGAELIEVVQSAPPWPPCSPGPIGVPEVRSSSTPGIARSLLASYAVVPPGGLSDEGETEGGFNWEVQAQPLELPEDGPLDEGQLQLIQVAVRWSDGDKERQFKLHSVVAGLETEDDE